MCVIQLGSLDRSKHKLFAVYFKVLNFHPRHTSNLNSMNLSFLIKSVSLKKIGISETFAPLIEELNDLYYIGVTVDDKNYFVVADCFAGDNLSSNFVGGFSCYFVRGQCCRFCNMRSSDFCETKGNCPC